MTVTPEQIREQRALGWPTFHPEDFCHHCGRPNISWFVDSALWNRATEHIDRGQLAILCPPCFVLALQAETGLHVTWELKVDDRCRHAAALREVCS